MKKRFFAIYALIGAFVASPIFTSCVEDEESASVTAIRNSKTEELKSIAALKKAEADAEATITAANIALKQAEAEAQVAAANLKKAEAALQETQNEAEAARLLVAKKQAEADLARIQGEIEAQELAIQAALLDAQTGLLNTKKQLEQQTKSFEDNEKNELMALANNYSNAVTNLLNAKKTLISMESTLAQYETGFANAKENLEKNVAQFNNWIAEQNIYIETYKQYANYTEDMDVLKKQQTEAQVAYNLASDKSNAAWIAYNAAKNAADNNKELDELRQAIEDDAFYKLVHENYYYDAENESWNHMSWFDYNLWRQFAWDESGQFLTTRRQDYAVAYEYMDNTEYLGDSISFEYNNKRDFRKTELVYGQYIDPIKNDIKNVEEAIKADKTALATAETETTAAKKAWDEAAADKKAEKEQAYRDALGEVERLQRAIKNNESYVEARNKELAVWVMVVDMMKNDEALYAALQEKIKAYNDAVKVAYEPVVEAWKAERDAQFVLDEANAELQAINAIVNDSYNGVYNPGAETIAQWIENCENNIKYYQEQIEKAEKLLSNSGMQIGSESYTYTWEELIAWQKAQIEAQKAVVAAKEVAMKDAKAALDAAMPADEEEVETPSEEETPAE